MTGLNLSGLTVSGLVATDASKNLTSSVSGLSPSFTAKTLTGALTVGAGSTITTGTAGTLGITNLSVASGNGNAVTISGGNTTAAGTQSGGALNLSGGTSNSGTGTGGAVVIEGGLGGAGTPAEITVGGNTGGTPGSITIVANNVSASSLLATDASKNLTSTTSGLSPGFTGLSLSGTITFNSSATTTTKSGVSFVTSGQQVTTGIGDTFALCPVTQSSNGLGIVIQGGTTSGTTPNTAGSTYINGGYCSGASGANTGGSVYVTGGDATASSTGLGGAIIIKGGYSGASVANGSLTGTINIYGGQGGASNYFANIFLGPYTTPGSTAGNAVIYIGNAQVTPSGSPSGGGCLYASGGDLYWLSSNGTAYKIAGP
jgi:hypothetical protein